MKGFSTRTSIRPLIFLGPEGETNKEEAEGAEMGDLLGVGVGVGRSVRGAGVGGAKGSQGAEGGGSEAAASALHNSNQSEAFWVSASFSVFFCFFASLDLFFFWAFLAFFLEARSSSVIVRMSVAP